MEPLTLTRDEADRLDADGQVVLFRDGDGWCSCDSLPSTDVHGGHSHPPAEFTTAAKPCETCGGTEWDIDVDADDDDIRIDVPCHDCLDGKRRITAVVPGQLMIAGTITSGSVTVATVVVEWGPMIVVEKPSDANGRPYMVRPTVSDTGEVWAFVCPSGEFIKATLTMLTLPPDVGQYALCIRKVNDD